MDWSDVCVGDLLMFSDGDMVATDFDRLAPRAHSTVCHCLACQVGDTCISAYKTHMGIAATRLYETDDSYHYRTEIKLFAFGTVVTLLDPDELTLLSHSTSSSGGL